MTGWAESVDNRGNSVDIFDSRVENFRDLVNGRRDILDATNAALNPCG